MDDDYGEEIVNKEPVEEDIPAQEHPDVITADYVKKLTYPADRFLCKIKDNWPKFKFGGFKIMDYDTKMVLVEVPEQDQDEEISDEDTPLSRVIRYNLGPDFLKLRTVVLSLTFSIGDQPIQNMEMVERHYFKGEVIRSYDFKFGFVIPNSTNTWDFTYDLPQLSPEKEEEIINNPWGVKSDSYFFADGKLIIHNRAIYSYRQLMD